MPVLGSVFIIGLRFILPALMLWHPFPAVWVNYFLDVVDGDLLLQLGMADTTYQIIDKFSDYVAYIFMLIIGSRWRLRRLIIGLFIYRTIGQAWFFLTQNELAFFYFQNFLEPLVMIYTLLIFKQGSESKAFKSYQRHLKLIWIVILGYKIWNEWYLHLLNIDLSTLFFGFTGGS